MSTTSSPVVLITGAAGNLGRACANAFAHAGWQCALIGRDVTQLQHTHGACKNGQLYLEVNLQSEHDMGRAIDEVNTQFGRIDALCHAAGGFDMGATVSAGRDFAAMLDNMLDMNVRTLLPVVAAAVPHLQRSATGGAIVTVGAAAAQKAGAHMGAYAAAKSALQRITESLSAELKPSGVRVNCVLPTIIDTPQNRAAMPGANTAEWVNADALAQLLVFLCSADSRALNGAALNVGG